MPHWRQGNFGAVWALDPRFQVFHLALLLLHEQIFYPIQVRLSLYTELLADSKL
jgi:hypothetical protein